MDALRRHERRQTLAQLGAREDDVGGAIGPGASQLEGITTVGEPLQAAIGDGRTAHVAQDALALLAAASGDGDRGVEVEAEAGVGAGTIAVGLVRQRGVNGRAEPEGGFASALPGGEDAADGGGIAGGEQGLTLGEGVEVDVAVNAGKGEAAPAESFLEAEADVPGDGALVASGRRGGGCANGAALGLTLFIRGKFFEEVG